MYFLSKGVQKLFAQPKTNQTKKPTQPKAQHTDTPARSYHPAPRRPRGERLRQLQSFLLLLLQNLSGQSSGAELPGQTYPDPVSTENIAQEDNTWFLQGCRGGFAGGWRWTGGTVTAISHGD